MQAEPEAGKDQEVDFHMEMKRTVLNSAQVKEVAQEGAKLILIRAILCEQKSWAITITQLLDYDIYNLLMD